MNIKIMGMDIVAKTINPKEIAFDKDGKKIAYCDISGKKVTKVQLQKAEYKWYFDDHAEYSGKAYYSKDGKAFKGLPSTKDIVKFETIEVLDILNFGREELTYLLCNKTFKAKMKTLGKAIAFTFVNVDGCAKGYKAVVFYNAQLDKVFMKCFRVNLANVTLDEDTKNEKATELVERESLDALSI